MTSAPRNKKPRTCPGCGVTITGRKSVCPSCGLKLETVAKIECPSCGQLVSKRLKKCSACGADLPKRPAKTKSPPAAEITDQPVTEATVPEERVPPLTTVSVHDDAGPLIILEPIPEEELTGEAGLKKPTESHPCPFCGAIIPVNLQKCPVCLGILAEIGRSENPEGPHEESPKEQSKEDSGHESSVMEAQRAETAKKRTLKADGASIPPSAANLSITNPTRKRTLRVAKVPSATSPSRTSTHGFTNGTGQINGLHRVNGSHAEKGEAFVNGTGLSNGLGGRPKPKAAKRSSFLTRWQFLSVLLAIVIIIPVFAYISYSGKSDNFSIDGDFTDWDESVLHGSKIHSTSPTSNIMAWAIGTRSTDLFLYLRTQSDIMSSPNAESFYLFIDSDGSNETGYVEGSIGADYMLQLTGWDSAVSSTSLSGYTQSSDRYNWSAWTPIGSLTYALDRTRLETKASMPMPLGQSAMFVLVSKDSSDMGSTSYTAPLEGGVLIVEEIPSDEVAADGIIPISTSVPMLTLRFTCDGQGGKVDSVNPNPIGANLAYQEPAFSLVEGEEHIMTVTVDTSSAPSGQLVSAEVLASGIDSSFAIVEVIGDGARAYVIAPPSAVAIDGAFADWSGRLSFDPISIPTPAPSTNINEVGNVSTAGNTYFYVSVEGEMCAGTYVPAMVTRPSGAGGSGVVIPSRHTAEDILRIYVDSDRSNSTGEVITLDSMHIGADQLVEVKGIFGRITSLKEYNYAFGKWVVTSETVEAAKDAKRIEVGISALSIGGSSSIDFIVETTSWKGRSDLATFNQSMRASSMTWTVEQGISSPLATSMSYQRKMFYDGTNFWSFFFDGADTVYKYSTDAGATWSSPSRAFATNGVSKVSIWYDSNGGIVYAVGDTGSSTRSVTIQRGVVDPATHSVKWNPTDTTLIVSLNNQADKNAFISKDASGHLWILSSNNTGIIPIKHDLSAFMSSAVDDVASWIHRGNLVGGGSNQPNCKGSILPTGEGKDMWAVYAYSGNVASRKYTTSWSSENLIYAIGGLNPGNTDNAPPSAVIDSKGVVHVVYGTGRKSGAASAPTIEYSHNNTGQTTFTIGVNLDPSMPSKAGDYYPTVSLVTSPESVYVLWLRSDDTLAPKTVMGMKCASGIWSGMTIGPQTSFTKQYLTSIYSVSNESNICWQWTQNATAPSEVLFDGTQIPEFGGLALPAFGLVVLFAVSWRRRSRNRRCSR